MKRQLPRVALDFATFTKDQLNSFAILVVACLKNNALFPALPIASAQLTAMLTAYQAGMNAAAQGGPKDTLVMQDARDALVAALRQTAAYIQSLGLSASDVLTSGFDIVVWSRTKSSLDAPVPQALDNSVSTRLQLILQPVANAKAYQVQLSADGGKTWQEAGIFSNTRNIIMPDLIPGTVYTARARAIGGSENVSPWSNLISIMCT